MQGKLAEQISNNEGKKMVFGASNFSNPVGKLNVQGWVKIPKLLKFVRTFF